jgi:hypothetical protein
MGEGCIESAIAKESGIKQRKEELGLMTDWGTEGQPTAEDDLDLLTLQRAKIREFCVFMERFCVFLQRLNERFQ